MKRIVFACCVFFGLSAFAQDKIILETGDTLKVVVANRDKKNVTYVEYDDPEFKTASISTERISKIIFENGKVVDFRKAKYPTAFVGIAMGSSMPVGDFAQDNYHEDNRSGFATGGKLALGISGRIPIWKFIGIGSSVNLGAFGVNEESYFEQRNNADTTKTASGTLANYGYASFSIGPDLAFKFGSRLRFFVPIEFSMIAVSNKGVDNINIANSASGQTKSTIQRDSKGRGMGIALGVSIEYMLSANFGLGVQLKGSSYIVDTEVNETDTTKNINLDYSWTQNVLYTNVGITARYHFN